MTFRDVMNQVMKERGLDTVVDDSILSMTAALAQFNPDQELRVPPGYSEEAIVLALKQMADPNSPISKMMEEHNNRVCANN